jgi:hypothetical protein
MSKAIARESYGQYKIDLNFYAKSGDRKVFQVAALGFCGVLKRC